MTEKAVCVRVDVAKNALDVAVSNLKETRQFDNDHQGITSAVHYIASLKPARIILEATGNYEMPLAATLQTSHQPGTALPGLVYAYLQDAGWPEPGGACRSRRPQWQ